MSEELGSQKKLGISQAEAELRLQRYGRNELKEKKGKGWFGQFVEQLQDPLIYVLLGAAVISFLLHEMADAVIICAVVGLNAIVGTVQEGKARKALEALKKLTSPKAVVIRDGIRKEIPAVQLVVGDLVCLEAGCQVPADLVLTEAANLRIEESALTGENLPVEKQVEELKDIAWEQLMEQERSWNEEIPLGDRYNMAFMSTIVTAGNGRGIVTATGMDTQIGRIAEMITSAGEELTPLQKRLGDLGKLLSILSLILCGLLFVLAMYQHRDIMDMFLVAISLAVAAVPEGLPAVVTICLALSVSKMVKANTIIRKLPSVETLGAVSVVCSDKTGTLTLNRMTVEECVGAGKDLFYGMVLCNDSQLQGRMGDPTELALLEYGQQKGYEAEKLVQYMPRIAEFPFDSERKMMTTVHRMKGGGYVGYTKGAPDVLLPRCNYLMTDSGICRMTEYHRNEIGRNMEKMAANALRTLAVAMHQGSNTPKEENLIFLGMVGMCDPVRPEAVEAVKTFKQAGVKTVMITGDHVDTAYAIAGQLGIATRPDQCMTGTQLQQMADGELARELRQKDITVFARVSPAQKVEIVRGFKELGEIVAMTGDGVNDAPSLKRADIGIAMGQNGTDVAKQASDMILTDDNFATIEKAIEEGRGVYENIRKSVIFLLSSNMGEILTMFTAVLFGMASPLKSSHILWINLITDSLPALALGVDKNDGASLMRNTPRKSDESLFARGGLMCTCFYGLLIAFISLAAYLVLPVSILCEGEQAVTVSAIKEVIGNGAVLAKSQTYAFTVLGMSQLVHAIGMRDVGCSVFAMKHGENKLMLAALVVGFLLQVAVTEVPFLINAFGTAPLSCKEWLILVGLAVFPLIAHECMVLVGKVIRR